MKAIKKWTAFILSAMLMISCTSVIASADEIWEQLPYQGMSELYDGNDNEWFGSDKNTHIEWKEIGSFAELKQYLQEDTAGDVQSNTNGLFFSENETLVTGIKLKMDVMYRCVNGESSSDMNEDGAFITLGNGYKILDLNGYSINVTDGSACQTSCLFCIPENAEMAVCGDEDSYITFDGEIAHQYSNKKVWNYNLQRDIFWNYGRLFISGEANFRSGHIEDLDKFLDSAYMNGLSTSENTYSVLKEYSRQGVKAVVNGSVIRSADKGVVITGGTFEGTGITSSRSNNGQNYATPNYAISLSKGSYGNPHFVCIGGYFYGRAGADPINETKNTSRSQIYSGTFKRREGSITKTDRIFNGTITYSTQMLNTDARESENTANLEIAKSGVFPSETFKVNNKTAVSDSSETLFDYTARPNFATTINRSVFGSEIQDSVLSDDGNSYEVYALDTATDEYAFGKMYFDFGNTDDSGMYFDFYFANDSFAFVPYAYAPKIITATVYDVNKEKVLVEEEIEQDFDYYGRYIFKPLASLSKSAQKKLTEFDTSNGSNVAQYYITYTIETEQFLKNPTTKAETIFKIPLDNAISFAVHKETATNSDTEVTDSVTDTSSTDISSNTDTFTSSDTDTSTNTYDTADDTETEKDNTDTSSESSDVVNNTDTGKDDSDTDTAINSDSENSNDSDTVTDNTDNSNKDDSDKEQNSDSTDTVTDNTDTANDNNSDKESNIDSDTSTSDNDNKDSDKNSDSDKDSETTETTDTSVDVNTDSESNTSDTSTDDTDVASDISDSDKETSDTTESSDNANSDTDNTDTTETTDTSTSDTDSSDVESDTGPDSETDTEKEKWLLGDVDLDKLITSADALHILRCSAGLEDFSKTETIIGDIDRDNIITSADALSVLRCSAGLEEINVWVYISETTVMYETFGTK